MKSKLAVVTGASSGIGMEMSRQLAERGYDLWLVARRENRLKELAADVWSHSGNKAEVLRLDLTVPAERKQLVSRMQQAPDLGLLVNNAGYGGLGPTADIAPERTLGMLELNITALTELSYEAARILIQRKSGAIINVASTAAFQPVPYMSVYSATKAYVLSFTLALAEELSNCGVRVMALCPGPTRTEFQQVAGVRPEEVRSYYAMEAADCVRIGLKDFDRGKRVSITGKANKLQVFASWLLPRFLVVKAAANLMKNRAVES